jgi:hypothetical protein
MQFFKLIIINLNSTLFHPGKNSISCNGIMSVTAGTDWNDDEGHNIITGGE